jgi:RNA polymerase sigma-70 factor (ECF subfamily)
VTMDVYHQVWRQARKYDGSRGSAATWLLTLTRSRAIDRLRSRLRLRPEHEPMELASAITDSTPGPDEDAATTERRLRIAAAMAALPKEQREVIETAYFGGLSHSEIAASIGAPLGTVKTRIRLGMTRLRELLAPLEEGTAG